MVSAGAELDNVLSELCLAAENQLPGATCSIHLVDAEENAFTAGVAPNLPLFLLDRISGTKVGTGVGSCGTAVFEKRDVVSADIATDPLWDDWRELVMPLGLRACWSKPVFGTDGKVIAAFGFYFSEPREPNQDEHEIVSRLRRLASLAIERARILEALRESEEHYRHTVEQSPQTPWTANPQGEVLSASSQWEEFTGMALSDALGNGWLQALHPDDLAPTIESWEEALSTGLPLDIEYRLRTKDGQYRWARGRASARRDESGNIIRWYGTVEDVHDQHLAHERLRQQAYQDELTGLPNRRRFIDELGRRLEKADEPIGLMVLDMDDFKLVNDRFGHLSGDAVLRLFARHLQRVTESTEFVARLGGDEFAIICDKTSSEDRLHDRARDIEGQVDSRLKANRRSRNCRLSIGSTLALPREHPDEVFKRADLALYAAKSSGKGTVKLFDPAVRSAAERQSEELELARLAIKEGWIKAYYQPVMSLCTQKVEGLEALLRINHPEKGLLAPSSIKAALDDPRMADDIAIRMAQLVVGDMTTWAKANVGLGRIAINVATENLVSGKFLPALINMLTENGLFRHSMKLEITERVLMDELGADIRKTLGQLRKDGLTISLDDFGTGYASLTHLQDLPVDEIKIDRSFVSGLGTTGSGGKIVRAMIGLAQTLGLRTVAEGIETQGEALLLSSWGCDYGQGYLFSRPVPAEKVLNLVRELNSSTAHSIGFGTKHQDENMFEDLSAG